MLLFVLPEYQGGDAGAGLCEGGGRLRRGDESPLWPAGVPPDQEHQRRLHQAAQ